MTSIPTQSNTDNPFAVQTPEDISAKDVLSLFVNVFTDFFQIPKPGHTFLHGPRGSGKSMMFRYLEPDCQQLARQQALRDLAFFGVYVPIKNTDLKLTELKRLENRHANLILNEHFLVIYVAILVYKSLAKASIPDDDGTLAREFRNFATEKLPRLLARCGWSQPLPSIGEDASLQEILLVLQGLFDDQYSDVLGYLRRLAFTDVAVPYTGPLCGYLDFLLPMLKQIKLFPFMPRGPIFLLIDDADNLNITQTKLLNSWVSSRTSADVSLKITTQLNYKTFLTATGQAIEAPHDFSDVSISAVYTSRNNQYLNRVSEIVSKRLEMYGIAKSPYEFFPAAIEQEAKIEEIAREIRINWETTGRGYRPSDDVVRYARPIYITNLKGPSKSGSTYKYAGFEQLVHISSGIVRYFLESASLMFGEMRSRSSDGNVQFISPEAQDSVVREQADQFLFSEFDRWSLEKAEDEAVDSDEALNKTRKLRNLIQALGATFHQLLISDASERRVFSVALSDEPDPELLEVFKLGVQFGYFHQSSIGNKEGTGRTRLFILSRRLAPFFLLDPTSFAGYKFVMSSVLRDAMLKPKTFVGRLRRLGVDAALERPQMNLFEEEEEK